MSGSMTRRQFLVSTTAAGVTTSINGELLTGRGFGDEPSRRPRVAAIFTVFRFRSHAFNFLENFFRPFLFNGKLVDPGVDVVSFYADQFPEGDMARDVANRFNIPLYRTIEDALTLHTGTLAVDAVLSIVEHGEYPSNCRGQVMYPRKEFFDQAVCVMRQANRFVPFFNDKHLSYCWGAAKGMYDTARACGIPLMAGSSVPLAVRRPAIELPPNAVIEEAVAIHGGGVEVYDFHGLELLQSFVESRRGGETGIASVEFLTGEALAQAAKFGRWSRELANAAMHAEQAMGEAARGLGKNIGTGEIPSEPTHGLLVTYRDGLRATVLKVGASSNRWNFACRLKGDPTIHATALFNGPWGNRNLFKALSHAAQSFFCERRSPYPVERTLLATGALDAAMWSRDLGGCRVDTPNLCLAYQAADWAALRELGESWKVITRETAEQKVFEPGDADLVKSR